MIAAQDKEIILIKKRNEDLFSENGQLQQSLFSAREAELKAEDRSLLWGLVGVVVGAAATSYLSHH